MATNNEEIIERKEGSPIATSCLVIATVAILGAIALQIAELKQIRTEYHAGEKLANQVKRVKGDIAAVETTVDDILKASKPLGDETSDKRVEDAKKRAAQIKEDAKAEADPDKDPGDEPEEAPEEPAEGSAEAEEAPEEPAEGSAEAEEAPEEPAEEDADKTESSLEDL